MEKRTSLPNLFENTEYEWLIRIDKAHRDLLKQNMNLF